MDPRGKLSATTESGVEPICAPWGCGTNSATVGDGVVFDELDGSGEPDARGVRIVKAKLGTKPVRLHVHRHTLSAIEDDGTSHEGLALRGMIIELNAVTKSGDNRSYELTIEDVSPDPTGRRPGALTFWAGAPEQIPSYRILSRPLGSDCTRAPICKINLPLGEPVPPGLEHDAIVFEGDHYDPGAKTVSDVYSKTRFNLACAGAAPAKMHLMRHTQAGGWTDDGHVDSHGYPPYYTTLEQRRAMLKMFTADFCGTGTSFTRDGQPLKYGDANGWYPMTPMLSGSMLPPSAGTIEALWDENGAVCLDQPRRALIPSMSSTVPAVAVTRVDVENECTARTDLPASSDPPYPHLLKPCTGSDGLLTTGTMPIWHVISALPPQ